MMSLKKISSAYLGFGSNIPPEIATINKSFILLENNNFIKILKKSSFYKSAPVGYTDQPDFYNCAIKIETTLMPTELLDKINSIEHQLGRTREIKWGPRTIDIDILLFDNLIINEKRLTIPHKELLNRNFVIQPLLELDENIIYPPNSLLKKISKNNCHS